MSDSPPTPPVVPVAAVPMGLAKPIPQEIKVVSHSMLLYWWPLWFFGLIFTLGTYVDNNRMAIIGHNSEVTVTKDAVGSDTVWIKVAGDTSRLKADSIKLKDDENVLTPHIRVSPRTWMGPVYFVILFLVILITNIPLRGLWSLVTVILIAMMALLLSLFEKWDVVLRAFGDLHIFLNMAGYLAFSVALLVAWVLAVMVFDRRSYMIVTPGQIKVCEEIGGREHVYDTTNLSLEKRRDDWFRHIILGFGSGDLTVKTAGADRHEIILPNVAFIHFKIGAIEQMLRSRQISQKV